MTFLCILVFLYDNQLMQRYQRAPDPQDREIRIDMISVSPFPAKPSKARVSTIVHVVSLLDNLDELQEKEPKTTRK